MDILRGLRSEYESHHNVKVSEAALEQAIRLSEKFIPDRKLPDKAIDVIDEAAAWVNLERESRLAASRPEQDEEELTPGALAARMPEIGRPIDLDKAGEPHVSDISQTDEGADEEAVVNEEHIAKVVEMWTGIPSQNINVDDQARLLNLESGIKGQIIGQDMAIGTIVRALKRNYSGVRKGNRPIGSFIFLGPTGVGKTELAKVIAEQVFSHDDAFIKIDLSEYGEKHAVSRLIGSPPGYVGYDEGGQLTEAVKKHPYSLVLFDEMEKAHPDVFHTLLQLLDEGVLTDGQGRKVYFHNTIVIFTTNLAGRFFDEGETIGFKHAEEITDEMIASRFAGYRNRAEEHLKKYFRPEFINRIDDTIYFNPLSRDDIFEIAKLELSYVSRNLAEQHCEVSLDHKIVALVVTDGYSPTYGARNIKRTIQKLVEDPLSEMVLRNQLPDKAVMMTLNKDNELVVDWKASNLDPAAFKPAEEEAPK